MTTTSFLNNLKKYEITISKKNLNFEKAVSPFNIHFFSDNSIHVPNNNTVLKSCLQKNETNISKTT